MKRGAEQGAEEAAAKRAAMDGGLGGPMAVAAHDEQQQQPPPDDELDDMGVPTGWRECPPIGRPVDRFLPLKVPLGARFDRVIAPEHRFNIDAAVEAARAALAGVSYDAVHVDEQGRRVHAKVPPHLGLVIDLTNSSRYYDPELWHQHGIRYVKIPCRGRGQAPQAEAVSDLVFEMTNYVRAFPQGMALIHCTHGFNRTGYMIASYLIRMYGYRVTKALREFAERRPPGIYKHYYIRDLFRYYHERLPRGYPFPAQPAWKAGDSPEHEGGPEAGEGEGEQEGEMKHDDVIGEPVSLEECNMIRLALMDHLLGPDLQGGRRIWLPGSQPVSLDATNKSLLEERQYWVTWKADGTRYMLVLLRWGTYLVDRKFAITRVQMRWPTLLEPGQQAKGPVGPAHHWTVLDGEMVVDDIIAEGRLERRFLAYDMVVLNGASIVKRPWMERYKLIQRNVVEPRKREDHKIQSGQWEYPYQYDKEPFRVRRKEFWPLTTARKLISDFIPQLCHEADGLIFQGAQDIYVPGTCQELLKWKFAHMNSVDFRLRRHPQHGWQLELLETRKGHTRGYHALEGARVEFPEGEDPALYDMRIIECSYDAEAQVWRFMRERRDKDTPNAWHVYESVARSIQDNIKEEELLQYIDQVLQLPMYDRDCGRG